VTREAQHAIGGLTAEMWADVWRLRRVLFDLTAVDGFELEPFTLGLNMRALAGQGLMLAIVAPRPVLFGVGRQIALYSGTEGTGIAVFLEEVEALRWLGVAVE